MFDQYSKYLPRITLAIIFLYHGLVPKLLFKSEQEVLMNDTFMPFIEKNTALIGSGIAEIIYAVLILILWRSKTIFYPALLFSAAVTVALIIKLPELFIHAFNPFTLNLSVFILAVLAIRYTYSSKAPLNPGETPKRDTQTI